MTLDAWQWNDPVRVLERKQEQRIKQLERKKAAMSYTPKQLPRDLEDADRLLTKFGLWAQDRYKKRTCASAEGKYKIPDPPDFIPPSALMADFRAMDVHRTLLLVPLAYRRVVHAHYIPKREPEHAQRSAMRIPRKTWDDTLVAGVRMFWNNWRAHGPKSDREN